MKNIRPHADQPQNRCRKVVFDGLIIPPQVRDRQRGAKVGKYNQDFILRSFANGGRHGTPVANDNRGSASRPNDPTKDGKGKIGAYGDEAIYFLRMARETPAAMIMFILDPSLDIGPW